MIKFRDKSYDGKKNRGTDGRQKDISLRSKLYKVARFDLCCGT